MNIDWSQKETQLPSDPVKRLQTMLRELSPEEADLPVDGVFGERTLEAVMRFQRENGLPVTGEVDQETWQALQRAWQAQPPRHPYARSTRIFPSEGIQVHEGETKEYLIVPQTMLNLLCKTFEGIEHCPADGHNGEATAANIRWLQKAAGLPECSLSGRRMCFLFL